MTLKIQQILHSKKHISKNANHFHLCETFLHRWKVFSLALNTSLVWLGERVNVAVSRRR